MWVVVVFVAGDVSAVPFSWILRTSDGKIMCYWPLNNPRDKIKKNCKPPESPNEFWQLYECRTLFGGATIKSYKMAIQNEKFGQKHSNLESQEESDDNLAKSRKHPRTKFSSDSDEVVHTKRPQLIPKCGKKSTKRKQPSKSSVQALSSDESGDGEYVFMKSPPESSQKLLHNATTPVEPMSENVEAPTPFVDGDFLESVRDTATTSDQHIGDIFEIDDANQTHETPKSIRHVVQNIDGNSPDETTLNLRDGFGSLEQHIETTFENDDENAEPMKTSDIVQVDSETVQINSSGTENIVLESIDFSDHIGAAILQKLSEVLQNQNDFKKVLVDLTYRVMKMEQRVKKLNSTPTKAIVKQLGCPVKDPEKFAELQLALEDEDNFDKLVTFVSTYQASSVNEFVKAFLKGLLDLGFIYDHIVWRAEGDKVVIKNTKLARCMFDAIKIKFPEVNEKKMEEDAVTATRQLKDCYRKKKK